MANQLEWARKQMDLEVPEQTVAGNDIEGREDFVRQACDSQCGRAAACMDLCPRRQRLTAPAGRELQSHARLPTVHSTLRPSERSLGARSTTPRPSAK